MGVLDCEDSDTNYLALHILFSPTAVSAYFVRSKVVSVLTEREEWITVTLTPQVKQEYAAFAREKAARARLSLLQRALPLVLGRVMEASHHGRMIRPVDGSDVCISPRLIVYACDYLEEQSVICLKHHGGKYSGAF